MKILISEKLSPHRFNTPEGYLIFTDSSGNSELFVPITVSIDGTQYKVLGHAV